MSTYKCAICKQEIKENEVAVNECMSGIDVKVHSGACQEYLQEQQLIESETVYEEIGLIL